MVGLAVTLTILVLVKRVKKTVELASQLRPELDGSSLEMGTDKDI